MALSMSTGDQLSKLSKPLGFTQGGAPTNVLGYQLSSPQAPAPTPQYGVTGGGTGGGGGISAAQQAQNDTIAALNDQAGQLRGLLGRTDTALNQGLTRNEDDYNTQVGTQTTDHTNRVNDQSLAKQSANDTIRRNAGTGYRSLAQLIGRASGTGSSAFSELLPNVVGSDTSSKTQASADTYGRNLKKENDGFQSVLADLLNQKKAHEEDIRTKIEAQRQGIQGQLGQNAAQIAQAQGGGYAAVKAAQQPYQDAINNSRNAVENFFNTFRTPYTPQAVNPNFDQYTTDRSVINAQNSGTGDATNPYAALLKKKQGATA